MSVSCHLRKQITSKATLEFELTIRKTNHFPGPHDLTIRPCHLCGNYRENIYSILISKDGICSQLIASKVLNHSFRLVPFSREILEEGHVAGLRLGATLGLANVPSRH